MEYNTGNYNKYMTKNPLKRKMVNRLNEKILDLVNQAVEDESSCKQDSPISILDAGCGEGFITSMLHSKIPGVEIVGLEYTSEAIQIAQELNPDIRFVQGDILSMPFGPASFDIVLCTEVLEHLGDPEKALSALERVANNTVIVTVPHEPWFCMGNMLALKNLTRFGNPIDHINHWTFRSFSSFLRANSQYSWKMSRSFPWTIARCEVKDGELEREEMD